MWKSSSRLQRLLLCAAAVILLAGAVFLVMTQLPSMAASALLHPPRISRGMPPPVGCTERTFEGEGVRLSGWHCQGSAVPRGSIVVLHGVADTRASVAGLVGRLLRNRLDVVAYDSRAHGKSGGEHCTYGYFEKRDLHRVIDTLRPGPVVLMGTSLGGAVALQAASGQDRVTGVVAAEAFADLETIARDRSPRVIPDWMVRRALQKAGERAGFKAADVSPVRAARSITVPVLLVHGTADTATTPDHSRRVLAALSGPKRLILAEGARHNESLRDADVWRDIDRWLDDVVERRVSTDPESISSAPAARSARSHPPTPP
jgi:alpha-beta hydrolase superfamily lysophospholipase